MVDAVEVLAVLPGVVEALLGDLGELAAAVEAGKNEVIYRHNVAHDGSVSRLLSILQVEQMVWVGMGAEVVFEVYSSEKEGGKAFLRILWGGQVLRSSSPMLGEVEMLDLDVFLAYVDGLVGEKARRVVQFCQS